jgi:hypothetical protein
MTIIRLQRTGASVAVGAWIKDDKLNSARAAFPEACVSAAERMEEIWGKMFDWVGVASRLDNAALADGGRSPALIKEDIDDRAPEGTPVCVGA